MTVDIAGLKDIDRRIKSCGAVDADSEWILAYNYYSDSSRSHTKQRLQSNGQGIEGNIYPMEVPLLRRFIDRQAVIYTSPPMRWLADAAGERLSEDSADHQAMVKVLARAQYDMAQNLADKLRALFGQIILRFYPSDAKRGTIVRLFEPYNVHREPGADAPDVLEGDKRFALCLSYTPGREVYEYWERTVDGWRMSVVNQGGEILPDQPYASTDLLNPYGELPVMVTYDSYNGGQPWMLPRLSRTSFAEAINNTANDVLAGLLHSVHDIKVVSTASPEDVPREHAPGDVWALPPESVVQVLSGNAQLSTAREMMEYMVKIWSYGEEVPIGDLDNSKTVLTGAALKVQNQPLIARREARVPLAMADEATAWRKLRAVHNLHVRAPGNSWGLPALSEDTSLEIEVADVDTPYDLRELQEAGARSLLLGTKSTIDLIMAEQNCTRSAAIKIYERVKLDNEQYPARASGKDIIAGSKPADMPTGSVAVDHGKASVVDAISAAPDPGYQN